MDQVREQKLLDWKMELKLDHLSPVTISFSEKIGCQMRVEIRLTEKGVTQHKKVLKLLANSLEVILNYTQQDWEPIYRAFDKWFHKSSFRTMESLAKISDSEIMKSGTQNGSLFIKTSNPMEERPSNEDNWKNISLHGDSIPQFAYSRRQFDELEINFETKTATSMENDDADFNGTLMDGGSYGFGIKMPMRSFDKLAEILLLHNLPNKSYIDACTKFVNTSQLATCDTKKLLGMDDTIYSNKGFRSLLEKYFDPNSVHTNRIVVHCHGGSQHSKKEFLKSLVEK
uniref:Uncharacterized protein n=1 Tax=Romanomermis culicivorax TaxID=13658 RepID=A0A915J6U7_ROMCU